MVAAGAVLPAFDAPLTLRSDAGFPEAFDLDQARISWAVSISSNALKVSSTVILFRSIWSAS